MDNYREPYRDKLIKNLKIEDFKVALSGMIIDRKESSFFLDDGTGQVLVKSVNVPEYDKVRVMGRVIPVENGFEIESDMLQDYSKVDMNILRKLKEKLDS